MRVRWAPKAHRQKAGKSRFSIQSVDIARSNVTYLVI
jgi:hypothetical protein